MGVVIALMIAAFGFYFWYSQDQIASLNEANGTLKTAVSVQKDAITKLENKFNQQAVEVKTLQTKSNLAETQHKELTAKLRAYDLNNSARQNQNEAEKKINIDTDAALRELEAITGRTVQPPTSPPSRTTGGDVQPPPRPPVRNPK